MRLMKALVILAIILAIFAVYFVFDTEKSISVKGGGNAVPAGIDIAKSILNQVLDQSEPIKSKISNISQSELIGEIKSKIGEIKDKVLGEVSELFCPQK